ncbi:MAG TPA: tetratricopeptide repeat protein, partial [Phycisphaerae bacterium]|nr:tetratricopeptide repeat protein [Phycisphaerae bacterium]
FEHALQVQPRHQQARLNLANLLRSRRDFEGALANYQILKEQSPTYPWLYLNLGLTHEQLGRLPDAEENYRTALRYNPHFAKAHQQLGQLLLRAGRGPEAILEFRAGLQSIPCDADTRLSLCVALGQAAAWDDALRETRAACARAPQELRFQLLLIDLLAGCPEDRVRDGREALRLSQTLPRTGQPATDARILNVLSEAHAELGQYDRAQEAARAALQAAQSSGDSALIRQINERLTLYRQNRPYRISSQTASAPGAP